MISYCLCMYVKLLMCGNQIHPWLCPCKWLYMLISTKVAPGCVIGAALFAPCQVTSLPRHTKVYLHFLFRHVFVYSICFLPHVASGGLFQLADLCKSWSVFTWLGPFLTVCEILLLFLYLLAKLKNCTECNQFVIKYLNLILWLWRK